MNAPVLWSVALAIGLIASLGLFWLMSLMVSSTQLKFPETEPHRVVEFVRLKHQQRPPPTRRQPPKPPEKEPPPPKPALVTPQHIVPTPNMNIDIPALDIPLSSRLTGSLLSGIEVGPSGFPGSHVVPLVRVPPRYPFKARQRRIEGWVKLEFTITREGMVKDIRVVDSHPPKIFDRAAMQAIARWKFKPMMIDDQPVEQRALQIMEFKLKK